MAHLWLTVWLIPHIRTLRSGSEARKSFTFWQTKCFFFVLVLEALRAAPSAAPTFPAAVAPVQLEAMAAAGSSSNSLLGKSSTFLLKAAELGHGITRARPPACLPEKGFTFLYRTWLVNPALPPPPRSPSCNP